MPRTHSAHSEENIVPADMRGHQSLTIHFSRVSKLYLTLSTNVPHVLQSKLDLQGKCYYHLDLENGDHQLIPICSNLEVTM